MVERLAGVRMDASDLQVRELLNRPVQSLIGVSAAASTALAQIGIQTVFDLGASALFAQARRAAQAADPDSITANYGAVPGDWLNDAAAATAVGGVAALPVENLRTLTAAQADALKTALDVTVIGDLAAWPPYVTAAALVDESAGGSTLSAEESQAESLRPRFGEFPTERVYYSSLVMLHLNTDQQMTELAGPLSIAGALRPGATATKPAVGAMVTFSQSWYAQGVTLGQMLHSLALAPGEATRIAMIDWTRTSSASASESVGESESLDDATQHSRAISEVQRAVEHETQSGGSTAETSSSTKSIGGSGGIVGSIGSAIGGIGISGGGSWASSDASSTSWSMGSKSITANMAQNVADRTSQHSTLVRNRRATSVREVSQAEHESVSTRIVANYNHMHALTVQYYEVVQIYRVETEVQKVDRVLLIPIQFIDFTNADLVNSLRGVLVRFALTRRAAELLTEPTGLVQLSPAVRLNISVFNPALISSAGVLAMARTSTAASTAVDTATTASPSTTATATTTVDTASAGIDRRVYDPLIVEREMALASAAAIFGIGVIRSGTDTYVYPAEVELASVRFEGLNVSRVDLNSATGGAAAAIRLAATGTTIVDLESPQRLSNFSDIQVIKADAIEQNGVVRLVLSYRGRRFDSPPFRLALPKEQANTSFRVVTLKGDASDRMAELQAHLMANQGYYTSAAFRSLDSVAIAALISPYTWNGEPLISQVEPRVRSIAGNYLVFNAPVTAEEPAGFPDENGQTQSWSTATGKLELNPGKQSDKRLIPIPTAGVFAEAVLGRSNSAEKIDLTRFWNWKDSPPPFAPPEIMPVATGSRSEAETLTPGQLGASNLSIQTPSALPDPTGLGSMFTALASGNTFRDMSGLTGTQQLAKASLDASGAALKTAIENSVEAMKVAADLYKAGKKDEGDAVAKQAQQQVDEAKKTHDAQIAQTSAAGQAQASTPNAATSSSSPGLFDTITGVVDKLRNAVSSGDPMPGTPTTVTERGGLRADAQTVDAISGVGAIVPAATKSAPAPVVTKKFLRMRFGDFLPARGKWWGMIVDNGFPGGDPLNNVASFGGDAAVEGTGVTIDIPGNREYRGPINILLNGTLQVDTDPADDIVGAIKTAIANSSWGRLFDLMGRGALENRKYTTNNYTWLRDIDAESFRKAVAIDFKIDNAQLERVVGTVRFPNSGTTSSVDDLVNLQSSLFPPDIRWTMETAFTTLVVSSAPLSGPNSPHPGTVVFDGIHDLDLQRVRIPGPATAIRSVVVHTSFDDVN